MIENPLLYLTEKIDITFLHKSYILKKARDLRKNRASYGEIATQLGIPRSTARLFVKDQKVEQKSEKSCLQKPAIGSAPFGFVWIMRELVRDEREQKIIQIMLEYYHQGMSFNAIAKKLSEQKIRPRNAGRWDNGTARKIILKHADKKEETEI